jgi:hypothetical protein
MVEDKTIPLWKTMLLSKIINIICISKILFKIYGKRGKGWRAGERDGPNNVCTYE